MRGNEVTGAILGAAIEVRRALRPGLLESAYEECLAYELGLRGLGFRRQVPLPVLYKEVKVDCGYRMDLVVEHLVVVDLKAVEKIAKVHEAQLLTYLKLSNHPLGLILNFHSPVMKEGVVRLSNNYQGD